MNVKVLSLKINMTNRSLLRSDFSIVFTRGTQCSSKMQSVLQMTTALKARF